MVFTLRAPLTIMYMMLCSILAAQDSKFTGSNDIGLVITGTEGHIQVASDMLEASYRPRAGYFELRVPMETFVAIQEADTDVRLLQDFEASIDGRHLTIRIYTEETPLDLGQFKTDGIILPSRIEFGGFRYENRARVWGHLRSKNFLFGFTDYVRFDPPMLNVGGMKMPVRAIKIFSENIEIRDFTDLLN